MEMPDLVSGVTQALGLNRLWETEEQADAEKRKSEQHHDADESAEDEAKRTKQTDDEADKGDVAPVSIAQEREKEEGGGKQEWEADGTADYDMDLHGITRRAPDPSAGKRKGYEWPMPASVKNNQAKKKYDTAPTENDKGPTPVGQEEQEKSQSEPVPDGTTHYPKASFKGSLLPFLSQQRTSSGPSDLPSSAKSAPLNKENPFERPRPQSSSSAQKVDRPNQRRQFTMPVSGRPVSSETKGKSVARSRWQAATHSLRFPLRRRKTERKEAAARGAEVVTILQAGAPAANLLASHMVSDERSRRRIPLIVDLLKVLFHLFDSNSRSRLQIQKRLRGDIFGIVLI